jgi:hypothetical protein
MSFDVTTVLIGAIFTSQILVVSFLSAWRFARANRLMRQNYPAGDFPRLYPISPEQMQRQHTLRMAVRVTIGIAAVGVLVLSLVRGIPAARLADYMIWAALAQILPMLLFLPWQIRIARTIRAMPAPAVRSAELRSWRVVDFVTPAVIALAIAASVMALSAVTYFYIRDPSRHIAPALFGWIFNGLVLLRMLYLLFGSATMARPDPYMSDDDLYHSRRTRVRMLFRMAIIMGVYFTFMQFWGAGVLRIDRVHIQSAVSVMIQLTSLFLTHRLLRLVAERDLTPYRADAAQ